MTLANRLDMPPKMGLLFCTASNKLVCHCLQALWRSKGCWGPVIDWNMKAGHPFNEYALVLVAYIYFIVFVMLRS